MVRLGRVEVWPQYRSIPSAPPHACTHVWTTVSSPLSGDIQRSQIHAGQVTEAIMFVHMHTSVGARG